MGTCELKQFCELDEATKELLQNAMADLNLSARAYDRILKVARTIADLAGAVKISSDTFPRRFSIVPWTGNCGRESGSTRPEGAEKNYGRMDLTQGHEV